MNLNQIVFMSNDDSDRNEIAHTNPRAERQIFSRDRKYFLGAFGERSRSIFV